MFDKLKTWVVDQVLWAETNMKGKTGAEKRQAVVDKLDDLIPLPWFLECMDGPLIGWLVDKVCTLLNNQRGHEWGETLKAADEAGKAAVAELIPDVDEYTRSAAEVVNTAKTAVTKVAEDTGEKLGSLLQQYGIETSAATAETAITHPSVTQTPTPAEDTKPSSDKLSEHFSKKEFACTCCGKFVSCPELVERLEKFRELCGNKPIRISSGTRCEKHNKAVGGASRSQHLYGTAADVQKISGLTVDLMAKLADQAGFNGIGKYNWGVHVDVRKTSARWDYRK